MFCDIIFKIKEPSGFLFFGGNMYMVLDIFCGAGGISSGFSMEGFEIYGGIDFDEQALETFKHNNNPVFYKYGDISDISNETISNELSGKIDIVVGGPPCQGFSAANVQNNFVDDPRNKLFEEFIRFIEKIKPKAFVMENVTRILTKEDGEVRKLITESLENIGYTVSSESLMASDYGVPQNRKRAFFIGYRNDLNLEFNFEGLEKIAGVNTVHDALSDLYIYDEIDNPPNLEAKVEYLNNPKTEYQKIMRDGANELTSQNIRYPNNKVQQRMSYVKQGENWRSVPFHLWDTQRENRHSSAYRRLDESKPSITIDTGHMNYFHPIYNRVPTIRESARIQSFPDSYEFLGNQGARFRQVGNAVPPLLSKAIAKQIKKDLEK